MEKLLLTNSSKGAKRQRALSTSLKASVSHVLRRRNSALRPAQRAANTKQPSVKLRVRRPSARDAPADRAVKTTSATALPALNILRRLGII